MTRYTRLRTSMADSHRGAVVSASEIAVLAGYELHHGRTPALLWREHTGRAEPFAGNDATWWGQRHEATILYRYVRDHFDEPTAREFYAAKIRDRSHGPFKVLTEFRRPIRGGVGIAHPDLLIEPGLFTRGIPAARLVQAKSHGYHAARRGDDPDFGYSDDDRSQNGIPASVFLQEQWELFCADLPEADVAPLINTADYREYGPVCADPAVQEQALTLAERFLWHVTTDREPDPRAWEDLVRLFPHPEDTSAVVQLEAEAELRGEMVKVADLVASLAKARGDARRAEKRRADILLAFGVLLGGNRYLTTPEGDVLARRIQSEYPALNLKDLKREHPDVYALVEPYMGTIRKDFIDAE